MTADVIVIGAGMGGLSAALRLAQQGYRVQVIEARHEPGGLAGGVECDRFRFDAGPYVLLDRPGLEWAFERLKIDLSSSVKLRPLEEAYQVSRPNGEPIRFYRSLDRTADELEQQWPGTGQKYRRFIEQTAAIYQRLQPIQRVPHPTPLGLIKAGGWRDVGFLLKPLGKILNRTRLPEPVTAAMGIWTHVAGQRLEEAPSPLALVPAVIHTIGAYFAEGGIAKIPGAIYRAAVDAGVEFRFGEAVTRIHTNQRRVVGVETKSGEVLSADAIVSNYSAVGTYLDLTHGTPDKTRTRLKQLPLQSPGVCAYLAIKGKDCPTYLRFFLPGGEERCRLLVCPAAMQPNLNDGEWQPARMIAPMDYQLAQSGGTSAQQQFLDRVLEESWWQAGLEETRVLATRTPTQWGQEHHLYQDSMNPVMTAKFMRRGRIAHRSRDFGGLYLTGSSTHPGQWVSFCAISGILAADLLHGDQPC